MISWDEIRQEGCMDSMPVSNEYIKQWPSARDLCTRNFFQKLPSPSWAFKLQQMFFYIPAPSLGVLHSVETPSMVDPSGICCTEDPSVISTQSSEVQFAVSGGQPLFTLGLPISIPRILPVFAVGPLYQYRLFLICFKDIIWRTQTKSSKMPCKFKTWMSYVRQILSWKRLWFEVFLGCPLDVLLGVTYATCDGHSVTTKLASRLFGSVWYGGLEAHWSFLCHETLLKESNDGIFLYFSQCKLHWLSYILFYVHSYLCSSYKSHMNYICIWWPRSDPDRLVGTI